MNKNNDEYKFNRNFVKKYVPIIFVVNCLFIWLMIIIGTIQLFGNGILALIISAIPLILNVYLHITTYIYLCDKYNIDQN